MLENTQINAELPQLMDSLIEPLDEAVIVGNLADEVVEEGSMDEVCPGVDVVVYTTSISQRPWVGRVVEMLPDDSFRQGSIHSK